jgi:hypothetical protein
MDISHTDDQKHVQLYLEIELANEFQQNLCNNLWYTLRSPIKALHKMFMMNQDGYMSNSWITFRQSAMADM